MEIMEKKTIKAKRFRCCIPPPFLPFTFSGVDDFHLHPS
jgi:hypothetical protein